MAGRIGHSDRETMGGPVEWLMQNAKEERRRQRAALSQTATPTEDANTAQVVETPPGSVAGHDSVLAD